MESHLSQGFLILSVYMEQCGLETLEASMTASHDAVPILMCIQN
jgi:hypothetical protein